MQGSVLFRCMRTVYVLKTNIYMYFIYGNNRSVSHLIFMIKDIFSHESAEIVCLDGKWHMMTNKYEELMDTKLCI